LQLDCKFFSNLLGAFFSRLKSRGRSCRTRDCAALRVAAAITNQRNLPNRCND
jgi:hypothetical protein